MTTALLVVAVVAALACPLHMLWMMRRGKRPACCARRASDDIDTLRERQRRLAAEIARRTEAGSAAAGAREATL